MSLQLELHGENRWARGGKTKIKKIKAKKKLRADGDRRDTPAPHAAPSRRRLSEPTRPPAFYTAPASANQDAPPAAPTAGWPPRARAGQWRRRAARSKARPAETALKAATPARRAGWGPPRHPRLAAPHAGRGGKFGQSDGNAL